MRLWSRPSHPCPSWVAEKDTSLWMPDEIADGEGLVRRSACGRDMRQHLHNRDGERTSHGRGDSEEANIGRMDSVFRLADANQPRCTELCSRRLICQSLSCRRWSPPLCHGSDTSTYRSTMLIRLSTILRGLFQYQSCGTTILIIAHCSFTDTGFTDTTLSR